MQAQSLLDLSPLWRLLLVGSALALLPVAWVWSRHKGEAQKGRRHALTVFTLFLTFDLVLFGAFTRLTDSGLGCPDWPGCYGQASPLGAQTDIAQAEVAMPSGPVTLGKAWVATHPYCPVACTEHQIQPSPWICETSIHDFGVIPTDL